MFGFATSSYLSSRPGFELRHVQLGTAPKTPLPRAGLVHRIDKDTSGLLVVAKTDKAHEGLAAQFADHSIERAYLAIVSGMPNPLAGTVRGAIARSSFDRKKMALVDDGRGKRLIVSAPGGSSSAAAPLAPVPGLVDNGVTP